MQLNEKITELRKNHGLSQEALADLVGVTRQSVSKWETGLSKPSTKCMQELCYIFHISIEELVDPNVKIGIIYDSEDILKQLIDKRKRIVITLMIGFVMIFPIALYLKYTKANSSITLSVAGLSAILLLIAYIIVIVSMIIYVYKDCKIRHIKPTVYIILSLSIVGFAYYLLKREALSGSYEKG